MINVDGYISNYISKKVESNYSIIGIFSKGIYLDNNHSIIMLHDIKYGFVPFGVGIDNLQDVIKKVNLNEKCEARFIDNHLSFFLEEKVILSINLIEYSVEKNEDVNIETNIFVKSITKRIKEIEKGTFRKYFVQEVNSNVYYQRIEKFLIDRSIVYGNKVEDFLLNIIGLGPGLTPSGDDFVLGYLYYVLNVKKIKDLAVEIIIDFIKTKSIMRTNRISNTYLNAVANGERFSLFDEVCFAKNEESLNKGIDNLLQMGNNSGCDILCGILYAAINMNM